MTHLYRTQASTKITKFTKRKNPCRKQQLIMSFFSSGCNKCLEMNGSASYCTFQIKKGFHPSPLKFTNSRHSPMFTPVTTVDTQTTIAVFTQLYAASAVILQALHCLKCLIHKGVEPTTLEFFPSALDFHKSCFSRLLNSVWWILFFCD